MPWADGAVQRVFQLGPAPVDWAAAEKALARVPVKEAKGIIALAKAELALKGPAVMSAEKLSMPAYAASRSLAVEVWLALAVNRAGVVAPATRRALGVVLSSSTTEPWRGGGDRNAFSVVARALVAAAGDAAAMAALLEAEVREVVSLLNEEDFARAAKPSRTGYDGAVVRLRVKLLWLPHVRMGR